MPWGTISFEDLVWSDAEGNELLHVPSGKIRVSMWDVITWNFKASAIRSIELNDAVIVADLDDNNRFDFAPLSPNVNKGRVTMPILQIPALTFENIVGDVEYQDGILHFKEVFANVYNGRLEAHGMYNIDTRAYKLYGVAKDLDSSIALKTPEFDVPVSANLNFISQGQPKDMEVWGNFWSGEGRYVLIPIKGISGQFHNKGRHLSFADVKVETPISVISTDALHIDNGELTMGPLNITSNGGSNFILYDESSYDEVGEQMARITSGFRQAGENAKEIQENVKSIQNTDIKPPSNTKESLDSAKQRIDNVSERFKNIKTL